MRIFNSIIAVLLFLAINSCVSNQTYKSQTIKDAVGDRFLIGAALNQRQVVMADNEDAEIVRKHFNCVVAENCMKSEVIHPEENRYNFAAADSLVAFAENNNMKVTGHCLIWHSQLAKWFCVDKEGALVSPEVLKQRMKDHISTIVNRYKGRIIGWDVVNEAIEDDGSWRKSPFYEILGEEYIRYAFECAHEADPEAELYYNDYNMSLKAKREAVVNMVKSLKDSGVRIDAIGMQGHMGIDYPTLEDFEESIVCFGNANVKVMITEWDMSALPTVSESADVSATNDYAEALNPYPDCLPDSVSQIWNNRMADFFNIMIKHSDIITRVTTWGVSDGNSWKNNFPVRGRHDYPLLFDRDHQPKPFIKDFINNSKQTNYLYETFISQTTTLN